MKTLIFDRNAGFLQYVTDIEDEMEALKAFDADIGIDPHDRGLDTENWVFYRVTDEKAKEVEDWQARGARASKFPLENA